MAEPPFFIVGQTGVGKTAAAIECAQRCDGEIVSADAFQVYAGLDLLTAKPTAPELARVPHHLVGSVPLSETYNVARYREDALHCIAAIQARGKRPVVVGGGGLYVKALTHGLSPLPPADPALRAALEAEDPGELLARLHVLDPVTAEKIDPRNKRRLVRAVEVCLVTGEPFSKDRNLWEQDSGKVDSHPPCGIFLFRDRPDLHRRIALRVEAMFSGGVVDEVRAIERDSLSPTSERIIGLADIRQHLAGHLSLTLCKEKIKAATRQYAKRQMTWFKREKAFTPFNMTGQPLESYAATWPF